ncbi:hypothetical protein CPT_Sansa64 [Caulobacter phage Sansa]|uniref:DUF968 domain-containing protein n=1 Tax=Caulobacter phage Sansa TaxID=1675600 RepID=A0A0K1LMP2_9CAUD|nr:hypothetical protein HOR07_gp064 [Caulobacter phage Sansa]AKU43468.1 hypothetical protein CPT_Sansa64 [Caulobacter phage Sansa]
MADLRQRQPREVDGDYKGWIAGLPCIACAINGVINRRVHVAHLRMAWAEEGLSITGKSEKPHDWRTTPLCPDHHLYSKTSQHKVGEWEFWGALTINPARLCRELNAAYLAGQSGLPVIMKISAEAVRKRICS